LFLTIIGWQLAALGGSPYYVAAGIVTLVSAVLLFLGLPSGATVYGWMLAGTLIWALAEVGLDGWGLLSRLAAPAVLGLWLLLPRTWRRLHRGRSGRGTRFPAVLAASVASATVLMALAMPIGEPVPLPLSPIMPPPLSFAPAPADPDWPHYGNTLAGTRFSPLDQITPQTVGGLSVAWVYHLGESPDGRNRALEVTPIKIGDSVYVCDALNNVTALDAETGQRRWHFEAHTNPDWALHPVCRGVGYYRVPGAEGACAERIVTNTADARLIALDAHIGTPCADFGTAGTVSLLVGMGEVRPGYYEPTSAPTIVRGRIVVGGLQPDNQEWGEPPGVIRAFDAVSGRLAWAFDVARPDRHGEPGPGESYTKATPNAWAPMSADEQLGLVYVPIGNATPNYFGGQRPPYDDAYSSSVVALDAQTGERRWTFQTVHHDLWDYDSSAQPTLVDIPDGTGLLRAVVVATKQGQVFLLDRQTGQPLSPVVEAPVPQQGGVPEDHLSATQPASVGLPAFDGPPLDETKMWGITPLDQMWCRLKFRQARYAGLFTPPGVTPSISSPGELGAVNWGGIAVDADRGLMLVNAGHVANYDRLVPRAVADAMGLHPWGSGHVPGEVALTMDLNAQANTPYASAVGPFVSPLGVPCQAPPYSTLSLVDLKTRRLIWTRTLGTAADSGPFGVATGLPLALGPPSLGGALVTRGGLTFIAATQERTLRAIDTLTGRTLWQSRLPAGGQATPMSYLSAVSGRQFIVVAAGGHPWLGSRIGDAIVAFALPKGR
jgi:quinoprotein glucose dehydrogenase